MSYHCHIVISMSDLLKLSTTSVKIQKWVSNSFLVLKISGIFLIFFLKNIRLGKQLLLLTFFEKFVYQIGILYFLKIYPIFIGSFHNFGRSDDVMIYWKRLLFPLDAYVISYPTNTKNLELSLNSNWVLWSYA